jgi:hypothetical protein
VNLRDLEVRGEEYRQRNTVRRREWEVRDGDYRERNEVKRREWKERSWRILTREMGQHSGKK